MLDRILTEIAGDAVAQGNTAATGKVRRRIIRDCLRGENGRAKVDGRVPGWMAFPPAAYKERGGVGTVSRAEQLAALLAPATFPDAEADPELAQAA